MTSNAYLWDDRKGTSCGRGGSSGFGPPRDPNDLGPGIDACNEVEGSTGREDSVMKCCGEHANDGFFKLAQNDCHDSVDNCLKSNGLTNPGAPGGRLGPRKPWEGL